MFREFKRAWKQAVENFWRELDADGGEGGAAYREVARVRNQLDELEDAIADTRRRLAHEAEQVKVCERRERLAKEIGDAETAGVAAEYRDRHRERASVLERKLEALEAERRLCRRDLDEMEKALQEGRIRSARAELEDLDRHPAEAEFRNLEDVEKAQTAEERLEELKRRMGK
jgi:chromosome segregation ATPase